MLILDEIILRKSDSHQASMEAETAAQLLSNRDSSLQNQSPHSTGTDSQMEAEFKTTITPAGNVHSFVQSKWQGRPWGQISEQDR